MWRFCLAVLIHFPLLELPFISSSVVGVIHLIYLFLSLSSTISPSHSRLLLRYNMKPSDVDRRARNAFVTIQNISVVCFVVCTCKYFVHTTFENYIREFSIQNFPFHVQSSCRSPSDGWNSHCMSESISLLDNDNMKNVNNEQSWTCN